MSLGHRHQWQEVGRTFNESLWALARKLGASNMKGGTYATQDALDRAQHGFTNIELRCSECGDVKVVQATGNVAPYNDESRPARTALCRAR